MTTQKTPNYTPAKTMADLLKNKQPQFTSFRKGDIIKAVVSKLTSSEILLDVNGKTEAVVLEKDRTILKTLLHLLKVGDEVTASVLNPESDNGNTVVSLRRFAEDKQWENLANMQKNQAHIEVLVKEGTKGGYLVEGQNNIPGFLPNSHISFMQNQQELVGQKIMVMIFELNRELKKVIFSQKALSGVHNFEEAIKKFKVGQKVKVIVSSVTSFGIFVSLPVEKEKFLDGLIHISEISWDKVSEIADKFNIGQEIEGVIIGFDSNAKRVDLSIRKLTQDPFEEMSKKYVPDQKVSAVVSKINDMGVSFDVVTDSEKIEGFMRKDKIPAGTSYEVGQKVTALISQVDAKKRRLVLIPVLLEKPMGYR